MSKFIFHTNDTDMTWILVGTLFCPRRSRLIKHSVNVIENIPCVPYDHFDFSPEDVNCEGMSQRDSHTYIEYLAL